MKLLTALLILIVAFYSCSKVTETPPQQQILDESDTVRTNKVGVFLVNYLQSVDSFVIMTKGTWSLTTSPENQDWFAVSAHSGTGETTVYVRSRAFNDSNELRIGYINIKSDANPTKTRTVRVAQQVSAFTIFDKRYGGSLEDNLYFALATESGGYFSVGVTKSSDGNISNPRGGYDIWTIKTDPLGDIIRERTYGGSGNDFPTALIRAPHYRYVIAGRSNSTDGDQLAAGGTDKPFIFQVNAAGDIEWKKTLNVQCAINRGMATKSGGYIFCGATPTEVDLYHSNAVVVLLDNKGDLVWEKTFTLRGYDHAFSIDENENGEFIVAGSTNVVQPPDSLYRSTSSDNWVFKIDAQGNLLWQKTFGYSLSDDVRASVATADGGALLAGTFAIYNPSYLSQMSGIIWVKKIDANGALQWQKEFSGAGAAGASQAIQTVDGSFVILGGTNSGEYQGSRPYILKLNPTGEVLWEKEFTTDLQRHAGLEIIQVGMHRYLVTGGYEKREEPAIYSHWNARLFTFEEQ